MRGSLYRCFFFFNDTATTEIYTLSLHDALPIWKKKRWVVATSLMSGSRAGMSQALQNVTTTTSNAQPQAAGTEDRKSTRLNSSHLVISYAVFCLKKKKNDLGTITPPPAAPCRRR